MSSSCINPGTLRGPLSLDDCTVTILPEAPAGRVRGMQIKAIHRENGTVQLLLTTHATAPPTDKPILLLTCPADLTFADLDCALFTKGYEWHTQFPTCRLTRQASFDLVSNGQPFQILNQPALDAAWTRCRRTQLRAQKGRACVSEEVRTPVPAARDLVANRGNGYASPDPDHPDSAAVRVRLGGEGWIPHRAGCWNLSGRGQHVVCQVDQASVLQEELLGGRFQWMEEVMLRDVFDEKEFEGEMRWVIRYGEGQLGCLVHSVELKKRILEEIVTLDGADSDGEQIQGEADGANKPRFTIDEMVSLAQIACKEVEVDESEGMQDAMMHFTGYDAEDLDEYGVEARMEFDPPPSPRDTEMGDEPEAGMENSMESLMEDVADEVNAPENELMETDNEHTDMDVEVARTRS